MILTGDQIRHAWQRGEILIDPFHPEHLNPNSYNFRLGPTLTVYTGEVVDPHHPNPHTHIVMPDDGYLLQPGRLYLAHTIEVLGGDRYVPTFAARSSIARLGLFIHLSAGLGDIGYIGQWTLQLYAVQPVRVYPGMCIGQMMWWRPHGTIQLYDGKYQHARGPHASLIHVDRQPVRRLLAGLTDPVQVAQVGGKFAALAQLASHFPVPDAFVIPVHAFTNAIGPAEGVQLRRAFADLHGTLGADIDHACRTIAEAVNRVHVPPDLADTVTDRLANLPNPAGVAVRSSAVGEDTGQSSQAGLYQSVLDVSGGEEVIKAVEAVWRSYYAPPAVLARIRGGDFSHQPAMAVIVQRMITSTMAGVAFTRSPATVDIEYVHGSGEQLMAGIATPTRTTAHTGPGPDTHGRAPTATPHTPILRQAAVMAQHARTVLGHDVDMEWAHDGARLWLLQCRPVTAPLAPEHHQHTPVLQIASLYGPTEPDTIRLGAVAAVVTGYRRKRCRAFTIAASHGAQVLPGWILNVNGPGLRSPDPLTRLLTDLPTTQLVLDLGDGLRQQIIAAADLVPRLRQLTLRGDDDARVHAVIVRPFLAGDLGILSQLTAGTLTLETSTDGLLAMNRGHAATTAWTTSNPTPPPVSGRHLRVIEQTAAALDEAYGTLTAEWIRHHDQLYFIDYSPHTKPAACTTRHLSPGQATGPIAVLDISDAELERLSVGAAVSVTNGAADDTLWATDLIRQVTALPDKPIIVARRPYAALSVLIGHVAGFIFADGASLCHLAILLREAGVPGAVHPALPRTGYAYITDGGVTFAAGPEANT